MIIGLMWDVDAGHREGVTGTALPVRRPRPLSHLPARPAWTATTSPAQKKIVLLPFFPLTASLPRAV